MEKCKKYLGQRFGRLVITAYAGKDSTNRRLWLCQCDCGTKAVIKNSNLSRGNTKSCGCLKREANSAAGKKRARPDGKSAQLAVYHSYRTSAKRRGIGFFLTPQEVELLSGSPCFYCGSEPSVITKKGPSTFVHGGIDRRDPSQDYSADNCVPCCKTCNYAKLSMTSEQFVEHIQKQYRHLIGNRWAA